mmetsp:Transcript_4137/g.5730  ORF Transcript_4137/g.5730 Transcript_4137/m.5730 type:complete len:339 (+) Transcript_4137:339-1355(+)
MECNLADLVSVRQFVSTLKQQQLQEQSRSQSQSKSNNSDTLFPIDILCLNAGLARSTSATDVARTAQGYELTVGTNHLGHFLLTNLLLQNYENNTQSTTSTLTSTSASPPPLLSPTTRIVVTASGVHDPESPGGAQGSKATLGNLQGLEDAAQTLLLLRSKSSSSSQTTTTTTASFDMVDGSSFDPDKAYKDSKLCNVFFTRHLQSRLSSSSTSSSSQRDYSGMSVNCFNPGLIVSTGLFRDQNPIFTKVFDFVATDVFKVGESVQWGGGALTYMATSASSSSSRGQYYTSPPGTSSKFGGEVAYGNQFTVSPVSREAMDDDKGKRLWELSEILVDLA